MVPASNEMTEEFLAEAQEHVETIGQTLSKFEAYARKGEFKANLINQLFRSFHSLKGLSGMLGFDRISTFTHTLEELLDKVRLGKIQVSARLLDGLYLALEHLHRLLSEVREKEEALDLEKALDEVKKLFEQTPQSGREEDPLQRIPLDEQTRSSLTEYEEHRLRECIRNRFSIYSISLLLDISNFDQILRSTNEILNEHGELISTLPAYDAELDPSKMRFRLLYATREPEEIVRAYLPIKPEEITILLKGEFEEEETKSEEHVDGKIQEAKHEEAEKDTLPDDVKWLRDLSQYVRVDLRSLDNIMNIIGEMFIIRTQQEELIREIMFTYSLDERLINGILQKNEEFARKLSEAQRAVLEMRLVPIGTIYGRLERLIRRLSRQFDKDIRVHLLGGETRLDKLVIERLIDPLVHIIRNAVDHGIEPPKERKAKGKPPYGMISIEASQVGNTIVIKVSDDGRGIQIERVRRLAVQKGILEDRPDLTKQEILRALFVPGFSSADHVTEVSGRGVGLDVVKKHINELNGSISVYTEVGQGSVFEIVLPITLAIVSAVVIRVGQERFAVPLSSVNEIVELSPGAVQKVEGHEVINYHGRSIPLIRLSEIFQIEAQPNGEGYAIVGHIGRRTYSILVDEIIRMQEIVIKQFSKRLENLHGISGVTEIGTARPVLVIDPSGLVEQTFLTHGSGMLT